MDARRASSSGRMPLPPRLASVGRDRGARSRTPDGGTGEGHRGPSSENGRKERKGAHRQELTAARTPVVAPNCSYYLKRTKTASERSGPAQAPSVPRCPSRHEGPRQGTRGPTRSRSRHGQPVPDVISSGPRPAPVSGDVPVLTSGPEKALMILLSNCVRTESRPLNADGATGRRAADAPDRLDPPVVNVAHRIEQGSSQENGSRPSRRTCCVCLREEGRPGERRRTTSRGGRGVRRSRS